MHSILISTVVLLVYILGQAHSLVLVTLNVSLTSSVRHDRYVMCLSDYPDAPKICNPKPRNVRQGRDYANGTVWWFSKDELIEKRSKDREVVRQEHVRIPWRSSREIAGEQYLIVTDWDDKVREVVNLSEMTLKNNTLKTTIMGGLSISVHIQCAKDMYGEWCIVGCNKNPRWTCVPDTGELICNDNWTGFHCNKEYCLHGGYYENRTVCRCTGNWTGPRCNDTMPAESPVKLDSDCWPGPCPSYSNEPHSVFVILCLAAAILVTIVCMIIIIVLVINIKQVIARINREPETPSIQSSQFLLSIEDESCPVKAHQEQLVRNV